MENRLGIQDCGAAQFPQSSNSVEGGQQQHQRLAANMSSLFAAAALTHIKE